MSAENFKTLRREIGTQAAVAAATGWSKKTIEALEYGKNPVRPHHLLTLQALKTAARTGTPTKKTKK